jgi:hypothetical protein
MDKLQEAANKIKEILIELENDSSIRAESIDVIRALNDDIIKLEIRYISESY